MPKSEDEGSLSDLDHLNRLLLYIIKRMRLIFHLSKIDCLEINAAEIAVIGSPIVESHLLLVCGCSELRCALHSLRGFSFLELASDRDIKVVQDVESP